MLITNCLVATLILVSGLAVTAQAQTKELESGFAIQNVQTGKNLRPYDAGNSNGNKIVQYDPINWKCMTWKMIPVGEDTYQLRNLFTAKTIQPSSSPKPGVSLFQQPLKSDAPQQWAFLKQPDGAYFIQLKGTDLFLTTSSDETNSSIILEPKKKSKSQEWKLIEQKPTM